LYLEDYRCNSLKPSQAENVGNGFLFLKNNRVQVMKFFSAFLICLVLQLDQIASAQFAIPKTSKIVRANNAFAIDLYERLAAPPGNFVFSPFSIDEALTMAYAGARGNTAAQMARVLHYSNPSTNIHAEFAAFLNQLSGIDTPATQFLVANSLWAQRGYPFLKPFQQLLHDDYKANLMQTDLTGWPAGFDPKIAAAAREKINKWAANFTDGKIGAVLPGTLPDPDTRLILLNAVYFKGIWAVRFNKKQTKNSEFEIGPNQYVSVPTMRVQGDFPAYSGPDFQALQLPYVSNRLSMIILLPNESDGLAYLEKALAVPYLEQMFQTNGSPAQTIAISHLDQVLQLSHVGDHVGEIDVSLPRFTVTSEFNLEKPLEGMGMKDAFSENADFSGMTTAQPFFVEAAVHKAYLSVNEQGTEAAAATDIDIMDSEPPAFIADHPFVCLIRDNMTGAILFMGRVSDPSKE
jgi:serine protease inhibitor